MPPISIQMLAFIQNLSKIETFDQYFDTNLMFPFERRCSYKNISFQNFQGAFSASKKSLSRSFGAFQKASSNVWEPPFGHGSSQRYH